MKSIEIFKEIYNITNNLKISINIFLVYAGERNGCIIEKENWLSNDIYIKLISFLGKYFIYFEDLNILGYNILILNNSSENKKVTINKNITDIEIGNLISYPCSGENLDYNNRKYGYEVNVNNNGNIYNLMTVLCISKRDIYFQKLIKRFQKSVNILNMNFIIEYKKTRLGNINIIISKLNNKKKLKKYEKEWLLIYFYNCHLIFVVYSEQELQLNIFKYKKMLLIFLYICDIFNYSFDNQYIFNKIFVIQLKILNLFTQFNFDYNVVNKIANDYLKYFKIINNNQEFKLSI